MNKVVLEDLKYIDYKKAWDYQEEIFNKLLKNKIDSLNLQVDDRFLYCEHPHVYTLGKSGSENNLLINAIQLKARKATFYKTNRGGDITYHGPGQIVGYPIIDLEKLSIGIREYIYKLEEVIIRTVAEFGIKSQRMNGATGVWIDAENKNARKICAIGVRASRQLTMHGFALNVNTDLKYFDYINPCGFTDKGVTSLEKEIGKKQNMQEVKNIIKTYFAKIFEVEIV